MDNFLFAETVSVNNVLFAETVSVNNFLFEETVSVNNFLFAETVSVNNLFLKLIGPNFIFKHSFDFKEFQDFEDLHFNIFERGYSQRQSLQIKSYSQRLSLQIKSYSYL